MKDYQQALIDFSKAIELDEETLNDGITELLHITNVLQITKKH